MKKKSFFFVLLLLCLSIPHVSAVEEITQDHVKTFSLEAPEGLSITSIYLYDLEPNSETTINLNSYGEEYTLRVNATKTYAFWWDFDVSLTDPYGMTNTTHLRSGAPTAFDYDLHVQYYWQSYIPGDTSSYDSVLDIDVYTGILPLSVTESMFWRQIPQSEIVQFSEVSAYSSSYFDIIMYAVDHEEFQKQVKNDFFAPIKEGVSDAFSWSWDMIVSTIAKIPYIGGYLSGILILTALTLDSIIFYGNLFIVEYIETTILTFEFFVLCYAFTRKGRLWGKLKKVVDCHIRMVEFVLSVGEKMVNGFTKIVSAIAQIIQALKPI